MVLRRRVLFVVYAVASYLYGWVVTFGVLWFMSRILPPKLKSISVLLAFPSVASLVGWPVYHSLRACTATASCRT